jgi:hypothetical protein
MKKTINVNGEVIKIKTYKRSYCGNFAGYYVTINNQRYYYAGVGIQNAIDYCYSKWVKSFK